MAFVDCGNTRIFYKADITKPEEKIVLLIHGLGSNSNLWDFLPRSLYEKYNFIRMDLPGHGKSRQFNCNFSIKGCAEIIERFLDRIHQSNVYVAGLSMGAAIALELALDFPEKVRGTLLVSAWSFCDEDLKVRLQKYIDTVEEFGVTELLDRLILSRDFTQDFSVQNPGILSKYKRMRIDQSKEAYIASCCACMEFDIRETLKDIRVPILLIAGDHDVLIPPYHSKFILENTRDSELTIFHDCAHIPFIEKPDEFTLRVVNFLSTVEGCGGRLRRNPLSIAINEK